jgi:predicted nucleic acid-binding protein
VVADASLIADLLLDAGERGAWAAEQVAAVQLMHAPHLIDVEVASAARKRVHAGEATVGRAHAALDDLKMLAIRRYPMVDLLDRIWELRHRLTPYDASYVALAEALELPLVTTDARLARAGGHRAEILSIGA